MTSVTMRVAANCRTMYWLGAAVTSDTSELRLVLRLAATLNWEKE